MVIQPDIRYLNDMKMVLYDTEWAKTAKNFEVYYMYRGLKRKNGLRYDITKVLPKMLGKEFAKTKGHEHSGKYQEIYTVIKGQALYLAQKCKNGKVLDVFAVKAKKGESVLIPSGYGHITINPSPTFLKVSNWIPEKCKNIYNSFEKMRGACYYYTKLGWIKNKNYKKVPRLKFKKPLKSTPKNLGFLYGEKHN